MLDRPTLRPGETIAVELVEPDRYIKNRNCVAMVTSERLVFLKKRVIGAYYEIQYTDLADVQEVRHDYTYAIGRMVGGLALVAFSVAVVAFAAMGLVRGIGVVGIPATLGVGGLVAALGVKRRRIVFKCASRDLSWTSEAASVRATTKTTAAVREFFDSREIPTHGFQAR